MEVISSKTKISKCGYRLSAISSLTRTYSDTTDIIYVYRKIDNDKGETL